MRNKAKDFPVWVRLRSAKGQGPIPHISLTTAKREPRSVPSSKVAVACSCRPITSRPVVVQADVAGSNISAEAVVRCSARDHDASVGQKSCRMSGADLVHPVEERQDARGRVPNLPRSDRLTKVSLTAGNQHPAVCEKRGRMYNAVSMEPAGVSLGAGHWIK